MSDEESSQEISDVDEESEEDFPEGGDSEAERPPVKIMAFVMLCVFQGYASMVGPLQHAYKEALGANSHAGASPEEISRAHAFTHAAVAVHIGKLLSRLGQYSLVCFTPYQRVLLAMGMMFIGVLIPPLLTFTFGLQWIGLVWISYLGAGIGLGIFEVTFLSVITPMGPQTKSWAIMGAPTGFFIVNVLGLVGAYFGMPMVAIYWWIVACLPFGIYIFMTYAPKDAEGKKAPNIGNACKKGGDWIPLMIPFFLAQFVSHFSMENWPAIFYMFSPPDVPLLGPRNNETLMNWNLFFAVAYVCIFLGDTPSRKLSFKLNLTRKRWNYLFLVGAVSLILGGVFLETLGIALLIWLAIFMVFWGNGMIYGITAKFIDLCLPGEGQYNLAAYSVWATIGDLGAILGGEMVDYTQEHWFCGMAHWGLNECQHFVNQTMLDAAGISLQAH